MLPGIKVKLTAKKSASNRTKNRIHEHGPFFVVKAAEGRHIPGLKDLLCILVRPLDENDDWLGWMPISEMEIEEVV
jgi:hypothetical protein